MAVLRNVRCRWASIVEPNTKFDPRWEIEAELDSEQAAFFADKGCRIKEDDGVSLLRFKRNVGGKRKDGTTYQLDPPTVVDAAKQPLTGQVGNGSLVNIAYELNNWTVAGNSGVSARLNAVQVLELVEFNGGGGGVSEFEDEGTTSTIAQEDKDDNDIF